MTVPGEEAPTTAGALAAIPAAFDAVPVAAADSVAETGTAENDAPKAAQAVAPKAAQADAPKTAQADARLGAGGTGTADETGTTGGIGTAATSRPSSADEASDTGDTRGANEADEGETTYDYRDGPAFRHKALLVAILATVALAAAGTVLGYISIPAALRDASSRTGAADLARAGFGASALIGILVLVGLICCGALAWPLPGYGPKPEPKPRPLWLGLLRLAGFWLMMFPFSGICLLLVAVGVDSAVGGSWGTAAILIGIGLVFGAGACVLLAGSSVAAGAPIKPGGKIPDAVRESRWWRHVLWMLALWALLITGVAVAYGVTGKWDHFWETLTGAVGSWIALAVASNGELPEEAFEVG